jgi:hypothetical protein
VSSPNFFEPTSNLTQRPRNFFIQNFPDGERPDFPTFLTPETINPDKFVACELEADGNSRAFV